MLVESHDGHLLADLVQTADEHLRLVDKRLDVFTLSYCHVDGQEI